MLRSRPFSFSFFLCIARLRVIGRSGFPEAVLPWGAAMLSHGWALRQCAWSFGDDSEPGFLKSFGFWSENLPPDERESGGVVIRRLREKLPDPHGAVRCAGNNASAVRAERRAPHRTRMSGKGGKRQSCVGGPQPRRPVYGRRMNLSCPRAWSRALKMNRRIKYIIDISVVLI